jgi:hypothetical protein
MRTVEHVTSNTGTQPDHDDSGSRAQHDPVAGNPDELPDVFGEDPDHKKPLVENSGLDSDET